MHQNPQQLAEICRRLVSEINYEAEINKQYKDEAQQETRKTVLEEFINSIGQYVERNEDASLSGFLETTALMDRGTGFFVSNQRLVMPLTIVFHQTVCAIQNSVSAAVIVFQADDLRSWEMASKIDDVFYVGTSPAIDGLIIIAHDAKISMRLNE